jgi:membrane fusion protein (multidrug efflux system)
MKFRQVIIIIILVALVALIFVPIMLNSPEEEEDDKEVRMKYVQVVEVRNGKHNLSVFGYGRVTSSRNIDVTAETQGLLLQGSVKLKPGVSFKRGQALFRVNDKDVRLALKARKSGFITQVASILPDLKIDFSSNFRSWEQFFIQLDEGKRLPELPKVKTVKEKIFIASKNILSEYYTIQSEEERLRKYSSYAPFDGTIVDVYTQIGAIANPGARIATVAKTSDLEIAVPISNSEANNVEIGDTAHIKLNTGSTFLGIVERKSAVVNQQTQSVNIYVSVEDNTSGELSNGMYVNVELKQGEMNNVMEIPRRILNAESHVYVVKDSLMSKVPVEVKHTMGETYLVSGLNNGQILVNQIVENHSDTLKVGTIFK